MNDLMLHRAAQLLEAEFGPQWRTVADMLGTEGLRKRVGKELTSFMAYPERGEVTASGVVTAPPKWLQHFYAIAWTISDITEKIPAPLPS